MKSRKNVRVLTIKEILDRLDRIDQQSLFFNLFAVFSLCITMFVGIIAVYLATHDLSIFWGGYVILLVAFAVSGVMIGLLIRYARKKG